VEVIVCSAEERCETVALDHGLLDDVKVGLDIALAKAIDGLENSRVGK
jgi:hypothetical protein